MLEKFRFSTQIAVSDALVALDKSAKSTFALLWEKGKYQTFPPFPFPFSRLLLEVYWLQ